MGGRTGIPVCQKGQGTMGRMETRQPEHRGRMSPLAIVILILLLLPVLYVLAIGPAHWLMDHGYISQSTFDAVYWEFIVVVKKFPSAQQILVWYIDLWVKS